MKLRWLFLLLLHPFLVYALAPVDDLRGTLAYTPPHKSYTRLGGLAASPLRIEDIPPFMLTDLIRSEDPRFFATPGVDPVLYLEAFTLYRKHGNRLCCVSGLTQQIVKNYFTGPERSFFRKYLDAIYAFKIERHFTKKEILTLYVNMAQTGPDTYGFADAAREYFGKEPRELNPAEAAFIVGALPAPNHLTAWYRHGDRPSRVTRQCLLMHCRTCVTRGEKREFLASLTINPSALHRRYQSP